MLLLCSSYLTYYSIPFTWCCCFFFLLDIVVLFLLFNTTTPLTQCRCSYSIYLLFLLDSTILVQRCCYSCLMILFYCICSMLLLFLLDVATLAQHRCFSCSTMLLVLLNITAPCSLKYFFVTPMILLLLAPFAQPCYSYSSCFRLVLPPPFIFLQVWKSCPNLSSSSQIVWKVRFFFQSLFVDEFF
jgi:hypothetical protein